MLSLKGVPWTVATALIFSLFLQHMVCHHGFSSSMQKNDALSKYHFHCGTRFLEPQTADAVEYAPNTRLLHTTLVTALSAMRDGNLPPHVQPILCWTKAGAGWLLLLRSLLHPSSQYHHLFQSERCFSVRD